MADQTGSPPLAAHSPPAAASRELTLRAVLVALAVAALMGAAEPAVLLRIMQDYRAGKIVGSTNRNLTILQLMGVPVGALAVAIAYPLLRDTYGVGGAGGLTSPISVKWAGFAELLAQGFGALPRSALVALALAVLVGVALTLLESTRFGRFVPSPTAVGLGMLIPGYAVVPMVVGGAAQALWRRLAPRSEAVYDTPLASGFITGEAIVLLALAVLSQVAPHLLPAGGR